MEIGTATMENIIEVSQRTKNKATIWYGSSTPGYVSKKSWKH